MDGGATKSPFYWELHQQTILMAHKHTHTRSSITCPLAIHKSLHTLPHLFQKYVKLQPLFLNISQRLTLPQPALRDHKRTSSPSRKCLAPLHVAFTKSSSPTQLCLCAKVWLKEHRAACNQLIQAGLPSPPLSGVCRRRSQ